MNITLGEETTPTRSYGEAGPPSSQESYDHAIDMRHAEIGNIFGITMDSFVYGPGRLLGVLTKKGNRIRLIDVITSSVYAAGTFLIIKKMRKR